MSPGELGTNDAVSDQQNLFSVLFNSHVPVWKENVRIRIRISIRIRINISIRINRLFHDQFNVFLTISHTTI